MKNISLFLFAVLFAVTLGLNADEGGRPSYVAPVGEPKSSRLEVKGGQHILMILWETKWLNATFDGSTLVKVYYLSCDQSYEWPEKSQAYSVSLTENQVKDLTDIATKIRSEWRVVGEVTYEMAPYKVVGVTEINSDSYTIILQKMDGKLFAFSNSHWTPYIRPEVGEEILLGRWEDKFCPITLTFGDPSIPKEMEYAIRRKAEALADLHPKEK